MAGVANVARVAAIAVAMGSSGVLNRGVLNREVPSHGVLSREFFVVVIVTAPFFGHAPGQRALPQARQINHLRELFRLQRDYSDNVADTAASTVTIVAAAITFAIR